MANIQLIRRRIKSTKSINQITKAMEMVAASKLRKTQETTLRSRTYAIDAREALVRLRERARAKDHPLFRRHSSNRELIILFTSDRGLAGAYNTNLLRMVLTLIPSTSDRLKLIVIGQKGAQALSRINDKLDIVGAYTHWPTPPTALTVRPITQTVIEQFTSGHIDRVRLLYTDFVSAIKQKITLRDILPIDLNYLLPPGSVIDKKKKDIIFEPSPAEVFNYIVPRLIEVQIYQAALEATTSEQAMRMVAMKNASDNAKDLMTDLTLTYNGARQAAITQELAEITSGT